MSFTWTGDPAASTLEAIRWEIDDIDSTKAKFTDAEINYAYAEEGTVLSAAAHLCEQLATKYAAKASRKLGPLSIELSDLSKQYKDRAKQLRRRDIVHAEPYAGGISKTQEEAFEDDSNLKQPVFERDMMKNE